MRFAFVILPVLIGVGWPLSANAVVLTQPRKHVMLVADNFDDRILMYDPQTGAPLGEFLDSADGLDNPNNLLVHPERGTLLVSNAGRNEILEFNLVTGESLGVFASQPGHFLTGMGIHPFRNTLLASSRDALSILEFDLNTGDLQGTFVTAPHLSYAMGFDIDLSRGTLVLANYMFRSGSLEEFDLATGAHIRTLTTDISEPTSVLVHPITGNILSDSNHFVRRVDPDTGQNLPSYGGGGVLDYPSFIGWNDLLGDILVQSRGGVQSIDRFDGVTGEYRGRFISAGSGGLSGPAHFLIVEVPEPGLPALLVIGSVALVVHRRRKME